MADEAIFRFVLVDESSTASGSQTPAAASTLRDVVAAGAAGPAPAAVKDVVAAGAAPAGREGAAALGNLLATRASAGEAAGAAGVGGAAGGLGNLAAAAGPVGIALLAATAASKKAGEALDSFAVGVRQAGSVAVSLAGNDNLGAVTKAANLAAEGLGKIPIVGEVFEKSIKAVTTTVDTFARVTEAFVARGRQLAPFSADLSAAGARAEVRSIKADVREAQELGSSLARLTDAQSSLSAEFRELLLPIKKVIVEVLADILEGLKDFIKNGQALFVFYKESFTILLELVGKIATFDLSAIPELIKNAPERIGKAVGEVFKKQKQEEEIHFALNEMFKIPGPPLGEVFDPLRQAVDQRLNVPIFQGEF